MQNERTSKKEEGSWEVVVLDLQNSKQSQEQMSLRPFSGFSAKQLFKILFFHFTLAVQIGI